MAPIFPPSPNRNSPPTHKRHKSPLLSAPPPPLLNGIFRRHNSLLNFDTQTRHDGSKCQNSKSVLAKTNSHNTWSKSGGESVRNIVRLGIKGAFSFSNLLGSSFLFGNLMGLNEWLYLALHVPHLAMDFLSGAIIGDGRPGQ
ncbi:hypothetical protein niasHT_039879 [Heterodera trifolii]|uniref:Uncharacterized protein n=1 Tax=Heterodera trifolii TaxID=157864 RepID=A0ABD2IFS6_9BILA